MSKLNFCGKVLLSICLLSIQHATSKRNATLHLVTGGDTIAHGYNAEVSLTLPSTDLVAILWVLNGSNIYSCTYTATPPPIFGCGVHLSTIPVGKFCTEKTSPIPVPTSNLTFGPLYLNDTSLNVEVKYSTLDLMANMSIYVHECVSSTDRAVNSVIHPGADGLCGKNCTGHFSCKTGYNGPKVQANCLVNAQWSASAICTGTPQSTCTLGCMIGVVIAALFVIILVVVIVVIKKKKVSSNLITEGL